MTKDTFAAVLPWTMLTGTPYNGLVPLLALSSPQSGWIPIALPMCVMMDAELAATGALLMFWFQG